MKLFSLLDPGRKTFIFIESRVGQSGKMLVFYFTNEISNISLSFEYTSCCLHESWRLVGLHMCQRAMWCWKSKAWLEVMFLLWLGVISRLPPVVSSDEGSLSDSCHKPLNSAWKLILFKLFRSAHFGTSSNVFLTTSWCLIDLWLWGLLQRQALLHACAAYCNNVQV